jgi:hypothetical protein
MCEALVLEGKSITTVAQAEAVFGKDAIEWNPWCEDYACENSPRDGYGPHAPQPTDCLCYVDISATARCAGYQFHDLPNKDEDGDHECFFWSAITPRPSPLPPGIFTGIVASFAAAVGFAACLGLITLLVQLDTKPVSHEVVATDRFGIPKPTKKDRHRDVDVPVYRYSCPDIEPYVGTCEPKAEQTSL